MSFPASVWSSLLYDSTFLPNYQKELLIMSFGQNSTGPVSAMQLGSSRFWRLVLAPTRQSPWNESHWPSVSEPVWIIWSSPIIPNYLDPLHASAAANPQSRCCFVLLHADLTSSPSDMGWLLSGSASSRTSFKSECFGTGQDFRASVKRSSLKGLRAL